jgi:hypothetical protein
MDVLLLCLMTEMSEREIKEGKYRRRGENKVQKPL